MSRYPKFCPGCGGAVEKVKLDRYRCKDLDCGKLWLIHHLSQTEKIGGANLVEGEPVIREYCLLEPQCMDYESLEENGEGQCMHIKFGECLLGWKWPGGAP